ncbi:MAG: peptidase M23 [Gemmatimonadetes bacterium]|nr:MAG: peptidase M23 [Gemmatimonadota bacterium]
MKTIVTRALPAVLLLAVLWAWRTGGEVPNVGLVSPVYAAPAETLETYTLAPGQTLGGVLSRALSANDQRDFLLAFQEQESPRRLREGTEVTLRWSTSEPRALRGVDVALDADETVRLRRGGAGWQATRVRTPVRVDTVFASGRIASSLWNAVVANEALSELSPADRARLIDALDKIFQWQIDFVRQIREGDAYRFAYELEIRPDGTMRSGRVLAAELVNAGRSYHALYFDPNGDGRGTYYDLDGKSVRRAFLKSPIAFRYRISSRFSNGRFHPILKRWRAHRGVDFAANAGTPVMATGDGVVVRRGRAGNYGNLVEIRHPNGFTTRYAHLSRFARGVSVGSRVKQGETIGYVGATGLATGPHLHYELRLRDQARDPLSIELPAGDPVPRDRWEEWEAQLMPRLALLDRAPRLSPEPARRADGEADGLD